MQNITQIDHADRSHAYCMLKLIMHPACNFANKQAKIICSNITVINNSINKITIVR